MVNNGGQTLEYWTQFLESLKAIYLKRSAGEEEWQREEPMLRKILQEIDATLGQNRRYDLEKPIGKGGTSVVIKLIDNKLGIPRALKFTRPIPEKESLLEAILKEEISTLLQALHPNIIEIFDWNEISVDNIKCPYYIMEFIEGVEDGYDFFHKKLGNFKDISGIFRQLVEAVIHLHKLGMVHLDLKPSNFLVSPQKVVKLSDLGSARKLSGSDEQILVITTPEFAHPELVRKTTVTGSPNRARGEIKRSELTKRFDLYALGKSLLTLLNFFDPLKGEHIEPYLKKYLHLMACRLLDGQNIESPSERALDLPKQAFEELKYTDISHVALDLDKVSGICAIEALIPEMHEHLSRAIQTSSLASTPLTQRLETLLSHPLLQRLAGISQLGLVIQVYPTATHSRLEHVLGTFSNTIRYIDALYNDQANPFFKQIMRVEDIIAVLVASLCHDIGQFPLAHDLQEALPDLFSHEEIGVSILSNNKEQWREAMGLRQLITKDWNISPEAIIRIIKADPKKMKGLIKDRILHTIIDGPIDADKLDYLYRDCINLNVPYAKTIDFPRLLNSLTIIFQEKEHKLYAALGIHEKGKIAAESVAFARYAMFGTVYWHHASRAAKAMLHRAVWEMMENNDKKQADLKLELYYTFFGRPPHAQSRMQLPQNDAPILHSLTQMVSSDREMLEWIATRAPESSKTLLRDLNERKLYKRLLVISARKNRELWEKLTKLQTSTSRNWCHLLQLERNIQEKVVGVVASIDLTREKFDSRLTNDSIAKLKSMHANKEAIILIDIPSERLGSQIPLEYLPETDRKDRVGLWQRPNVLEDSAVWKALHEKFLESAGKYRLFCHPDALDTLLALIQKGDLELEDIPDSEL